MKKVFALLSFAAVAVVAPSLAFADSAEVAAQKNILTVDGQLALLRANIAPLDLINWKVGDTAKYDVKVGSFGKLGTSTKSVTKDEGTALWVTQNMDLMIKKQKAEILLNKADGKTLKMIVDGKEQDIPDDKVEIISQDYAEVTVPAGTFKTIHVVAKTAQVDQIEIWANPRDTVMDGAVKQAVKAQGMDILMELTSFKRIP
jgi:hypothetical protein